MTTPNLPFEYGPDGRLRLPGFGLPIDAEPQIPSCFLHPLSGNHFESDGLKLREIRMMDFISFVTDKPNWEVEFFNEQTLRTWLEEARLAHLPDLDDDVFFSEEMYKARVDELHEKATYLNNTGLVHILDAELAVAKSDTAVTSTLAAALGHNTTALEYISLQTKGWEPGSDYTVLNLLNPSLFPLIYGTTRVLPLEQDRLSLDNCLSYISGRETISEFDRAGMRRPAYRGATQWLPSNIEWSQTGPRITGYVNGLHPTYRGLYHVLERFIAAAVPLWEDCLFRGQDRRAPRIGTCSSGNGDYFMPADAERERHVDGQVGWCLDYE
ncbi:hypothetical protein F4821DRAFT_55024 [Hypoxylon rubiginosum]|uniref:Uncharacterized protein n=1 Tax=Hypoxylon rubiginosum TaxID=110542 RepID=A0ACC0CJ99_9PEZI|nr:hypothetical protein F4821DRAFT_55024 [Hypoxylon rubiginosum]